MSRRPRALITGITGQDGSYLAELLLAKGYEVHGLVRNVGSEAAAWIAGLGAGASGPAPILHEADLAQPASLQRAFEAGQPEEVYHLAGQSHVGLSFAHPERTAEITGMGTLRLLELARSQPRPPRFFQASSAEIFGRPDEAPQSETTPTAPVTPYGCAIAFATHLARTYRQAHGLFVTCGILYNHESPRRGDAFVTRKICRAVAAIQRGEQRELLLGNLDARRDWGHARDFVRAMWQALQQPEPRDYVVATGRLHTVRDVVELAFGAAGLDWRQHVRQDPALFRPAEPYQLVGDPGRAERELGWRAETGFADMIREMVAAELDRGAGSGVEKPID